jgi:hypothetical protein
MIECSQEVHFFPQENWDVSFFEIAFGGCRASEFHRGNARNDVCRPCSGNGRNGGGGQRGIQARSPRTSHQPHPPSAAPSRTPLIPKIFDARVCNRKKAATGRLFPVQKQMKLLEII